MKPKRKRGRGTKREKEREGGKKEKDPVIKKLTRSQD
jgi:hypothetical protein